MRERFALEMRTVGGLSHPNIVTAFDAREIDGTTVLVTEYIDGLDLGKVINRLGSLSTADACQIALIVAQVLAYTEQRGFVHRDIKPSNIMRSSQGTVKVLDLGLARIALFGSENAELTLTGQALGSPDYAAPEQIQDSRTVDARSDIYSRGCTLFRMLSGHHVFDSMLEKDPNKRPQSATELTHTLQAFVVGSNLSSLIELMGLFFGIVITITQRDGTQTKITVPDGSRIEIDSGNSTAAIAATASPSSTPSQSSVDAAAAAKPTGFLVDNTPAALPTLKKVVVFSSKKPAQITQTHVDLPAVALRRITYM